MRFIEPEFFSGCIGAWCPSFTRSGRYLIDHSDYGQRLDLNSFTNAALEPTGLDTDPGYATAPFLGGHLTQPRLTFSMWVSPKTLSGTQWVAGAWRGTAGERGYGFRLSASTLEGFYSTAGTSAASIEGPAGTVLFNQWNHFVFSVGPNGARLYQNGVLVDSDPSTTSIHAADARFALGTIINSDPTPFSDNFNGLIDDIQLYNRQLLDAEVFELSKQRAGLYTPRRFRRTVPTEALSTQSFLDPQQTVVAEIISSRVAFSAITLTDDAIAGGPKPADAESTLAFNQTAIAAGLLNAAAESTISLIQAAGAEGPVSVDAENTLAITDEARAAGPKTGIVSSTLELVSSTRVPEEITAFAFSELALSAASLQFGPKPAIAENTIALVSTGDTNIKIRLNEQTLELVQEVDVTSSKLVRQFLTLTQTVDLSIQVTATSHLIDLISLAKTPNCGINSLALTQSVGVVRPSTGRFAQNALTLAQIVAATGSLGKSAASALNLLQAVAYSTNAATRFCHYSPFVGGGSMPTLIPSADDGGFTTGLKLDDGSTALTISRSMSYGDVDRLVFDRINRTSRGGTLLVFADPIWPKLESLVFSVSAVKKSEARAFLDYLEPRVGQQMTLTTHEGRQWQGVILNPQDAVIQDAHDSYTLSIEFQGAEV